MAHFLFTAIINCLKDFAECFHCMCAFRLSRAIWKIKYRIKHRIIKMTLNSVSPMFKGDGNIHIYSYFITLCNYSQSKFEDKIGTTVSPPSHLTASSYFFFFLFYGAMLASSRSSHGNFRIRG